MNIRQRLKEISMSRAMDLSVRDVRIGLGYTAVLLENNQAGVAYTFHREMIGGCTVFKGLRPLAGRTAQELLELFDSKDSIESAVALATCNAISNACPTKCLDGDILDYLKLDPDDKVGMVGYFAPLVPMIRKKASSLMIFEQVDRAGDVMLPESDAYRRLPECQVALVTSTAILNHTIDDILDIASSCRELVLLGPSTPLVPEAFAQTPVTALSGVTVQNPLEIMRIVSEGGGMRLFKGYVKKLNLAL